MMFDPANTTWRQLDIKANWASIKQYEAWRRQAITLYVHELVHAFDWLITCRQDAEKWNARCDGTWERRADNIQNIVLVLLGLRRMVGW